MKVGGRIPAFVLAAALVAAGVGWETTHAASSLGVTDGISPRSAAGLSPVGASGAVWFCPLVASTHGIVGAGIRITSSKVTKVPTKVLVSLHGPAGEVVTSNIEVGESGVTVSIAELLKQVPSLEIQTLPSLAATVESETDPSVVVEATLGDKSAGAVPCASTVSSQWYLTDGSTALGASTELVLFNPFSGPALVDVRFWTDRGAARPTALQGVSIPAGALRVIDVGQFVRRRDRMATEVSVRSGRMITAENRRVFQQSELIVATPSLSSEWFVPVAQWSPQRADTFTIVNPGIEDATVEIAATLSPEDVEQFELVVAAGTTEVFTPSAEDGRIPSKTPYALVFNVKSGPPIVVGRTATAKTRQFGYVANPFTSRDWVVQPGGGDVAVFNPYEVPTTVSVTTMRAGKKVAVLPSFKLAAGAFKVLARKDLQPATSSAGVERLNIVSPEAEVVVSRSDGFADALATGRPAS
jgi:Family of unknown function (DUF5719)